MSLVKYNAVVNDFVPTSFGHLIDRFFGDAARSGGSAYSFIPRVDVLETEKAYELHLAVPGMNKEDFKISLDENLLTVSGERKFVKNETGAKFHKLESQYGTFSRTFTLPTEVDANNIAASYKNGVLEVVIPKDEKKGLKTSIKVS